MRIVLNRKGFDSSYGGCPSPILPDGTLLTLPIPEEGKGSVRYGELRSPAGSLGDVVSALTGRRFDSKSRAHLDPDLDPDVRERDRQWVPAFGQAGAAARHLDNQDVGVGDVFLFFGWFRQTENFRGTLRFAPLAPDLHVLFGWLKVGSVLRKPTAGLTAHPHFVRTYDNSRVCAADSLSHGGLFRTFSPKLRLSAKGETRSQWCLPKFFHPRGRTPLTYHARPDRWRLQGDKCYLNSVARGQEFVLQADEYPPQLLKWVRDLGARIT